MCLNTKLHFALICELLQVKFCKRNPGFMDSVRLGAVRAIDECQYQFRQRRWNCSSLQDNVNSHMDIIKAHLGGKMTESELAGLKVSGLPALPSSSLYSQQSLMGVGNRMYGASEPDINAMFNSYNFKEGQGKREGRNSRNVRRSRNERRSRKGKTYDKINTLSITLLVFSLQYGEPF